jgi:hypothetical protein
MRRNYVVPMMRVVIEEEDEIPGGALSLKLLTTQTVVTAGILQKKKKFPR